MNVVLPLAAGSLSSVPFFIELFFNLLVWQDTASGMCIRATERVRVNRCDSESLGFGFSFLLLRRC